MEPELTDEQLLNMKADLIANKEHVGWAVALELVNEILRMRGLRPAGKGPAARQDVEACASVREKMIGRVLADLEGN